MKIKSCLNCEDRYIGCHATCERYLSEKEELEASKRQLREARQGFMEAEWFKRDMINKTRKKH